MATTSLLENLASHIMVPLLDFFPLAQLRLHNFTDADLTAAAPVLLIRRSGTGGDDDNIAQQIDADLTLLVAPTAIKDGEDCMHTLRTFLKSDAGCVGAGVYGYVVFSHLIGPVQLQNGRHRYMFMVRCFTETQ